LSGVEAVVAAESVALVLLVVLVTGLLRSHAEILRRLDDEHGRGPAGAPTALAPARDGAAATAADVAGTTPAGGAAVVTMRGGRDTVLAFLTTGCATCEGFWRAFADPALPVPGGARVVVVARGEHEESRSRLRRLAPPGVVTVLSSDAWDDYAVPLAPYFVHVDGATGTVRGEGAARDWAQVASLLGDALADADPDGVATRAERADRALGVARIGPGHASLYTAGEGQAVEAGS
jgi:hypothetical protein